MDAKLLKVILDDETLTDEQIAVLLVKAQKQAANQHFWADDDLSLIHISEPTRH